MYTGDKTTRITLRLNEAQFTFVKDFSDTLGVSPSEFLRMTINSAMATQKAIADRSLKVSFDGGQGRENDKADSDHFV